MSVFDHMRSKVYPDFFFRTIQKDSKMKSIDCSGCGAELGVGDHVYWEQVGHKHKYYCTDCVEEVYRNRHGVAQSVVIEEPPF